MLCLIRQETPPPPLRFSPSSPPFLTAIAIILARTPTCLPRPSGGSAPKRGIERRCWTKDLFGLWLYRNGRIFPPPPLLQGFVCGVRPPSFLGVLAAQIERRRAKQAAIARGVRREGGS